MSHRLLNLWTGGSSASRHIIASPAPCNVLSWNCRMAFCYIVTARSQTKLCNQKSSLLIVIVNIIIIIVIIIPGMIVMISAQIDIWSKNQFSTSISWADWSSLTGGMEIRQLLDTSEYPIDILEIRDCKLGTNMICTGHSILVTLNSFDALAPPDQT